MKSFAKFAGALILVGIIACAMVEWTAQLAETTDETVARHTAMLEAE